MPNRDARRIICWGDSLTAGAGASVSSDYVAQAGLMLPGHQLTRMGFGGWTSQQIATRQGALPLRITAPDIAALTAIPGSRIQENFAAGAGEWLLPAAAGLTLAAAAGRLRYVGQGQTALTIQHKVISPPTATVWARVRAKVTAFTPGLNVQIGFHNLSSFVGGTITINDTGLFEAILNPSITAVRFAIAKFENASLPNWELEFDSIEVEFFTAEPAAVPVGKEVNILGASGSFYGALRGSLDGVYGYLSTDSAGVWTFQRRQAGPARLANPGAVFTIETVADTLHQTHWIWAGRNNTGATDEDHRAGIVGDIAAMVAALPHDRFLIGAVLNGGGEYAGTTAHRRITGVNADLASLYGRRFVDVRTPLIAAGDPLQDAADIAGDTTPTSLRTDGIHLTSAGYAIVAKQFVEAHQAMWW